MAEAAAWVDWSARPDASKAEAAAFERWMGESEAHRRAFADLAALWRSDALGEAAADLAVASSRRGERVLPWRYIIPAAVTAAAAALVVLYAPWMDYRTLETGRAQSGETVLADGSTVRLSGGARLVVRQSPMGRSATLDRGEAFFDVRHDGRPFTVAAGEGQVQVMGTAFNIDRLSSGRTEVALYRGAVRVRGRSRDTVDLAPGERVIVDRGRLSRGAPLRAARPDWLDGWFDAQDASLSQLAEEVDRFSDKPVEVDPEVRRMRISGRFQVAEPRAVLALIEVAYGVRVVEESDRIRIER
ncbi:FecR family protein [Brevundimonas sp.]|jgi:transmembrane sensor|uniref:FecR family protein n=1 Tax=Brevundimonas sp. TaxID=1871086 RepID=UPI0037C177B3